MTDQFKEKLEEKKKIIDDYITNAKDSTTKNIFLTLKRELDRTKNIKDLEKRIRTVRDFKGKAKKYYTRSVFEVFEKELLDLRSSLQISEEKMPPEETKAEKAILHRPEEISGYIRDGEPDVAVVSLKITRRGKVKKRLKRIRSRLPARRHVTVKKPEAAEAPRYIINANPTIDMGTLSDIHKLVKKRKTVPKKISDTDKNVKKIGNVAFNVPKIRLGVETHMKDMKGHKEAVSDIRKSEDSIHKQVEEVRNSLSRLKTDVSEKVLSEKLRSQLKQQEMLLKQREAERMIEKSTEKLNMKVEMMSRNLDEALERLSRRIDESSKIGKLEMTGNIEYLKGQIEQLRSELPKFAKKDIAKAAAEKPRKTHRKRHKKPAHKPREADYLHLAVPKEKPVEEPPAVKISELEKYKGKKVVIEADVAAGSKVEDGEVTMYGYKVSDSTGEVMMTSLTEVPAGRNMILCEVIEASGRIYLRFVKPA
ncbi:MAG: hypothetical protein J7K54_00100 [Candidatus Aenigmarchaeota archaeon]|nr:hypothetical protein [Candidatus Aenigmarchaeota archaeon]